MGVRILFVSFLFLFSRLADLHRPKLLPWYSAAGGDSSG
jgi:hypothetical protein